MNFPVKMTSAYKDVLSSVRRITTTSPVLFYSTDEMSLISHMENNLLIHISTPKTNFLFPDKIGVRSVSDFINYMDSINFPAEGEVYVSDETTVSGNQLSSIVFLSDTKKYNMELLADVAFNMDNSTKIPSSREEDPMECVATFEITQDDIKSFLKDVKLVGKEGKSFGLTITDNEKLSVYLRGIYGQQSRWTILDSTIVKPDSPTFSGAGSESFILFPSSMFEKMSYFPCNFSCDFRSIYTGNGIVSALKCYGKVDCGDSGIVDVYIGCVENQAEVVGSFDVVK